MLPRWYSTAFGVMNYSAAISALVIPCSIRWATSVSRSVISRTERQIRRAWAGVAALVGQPSVQPGQRRGQVAGRAALGALLVQHCYACPEGSVGTKYLSDESMRNQVLGTAVEVTS